MNDLYDGIMIDWLIDYCLTSREQDFSYIRDENKFNTIYTLYRNGGGWAKQGIKFVLPLK
jgi:hypothetical protein